ncbi:hypothetical protein BE17_31590 [Sorangium cellulosum]|uniref:GyrI-like small molecule binding domain-containing protein n=1 Tax=Sorangium cellulosum TaxID=56 RepID=A0A150R3P2_SORCE|nr:hypothetical protein BE17_31590 [Sorangium cellulosum]
MSSDETTPKPPRRLRARGAPATATGGHDVEETWRQTVRGLVVPLGRALTLAALRAACARLAELAERQQLALIEEPLFGLRGDPGEDPPDRWDYEAVLPVRGAAAPQGDVKVARVEGGLHLAAITPRGLDDLKRLYSHLLGTVLPSRKQRLARPYILHRVHGLTGRQEREPDEAVAVAVYVPAVLSIKPVPAPADEAEG